MGATVVRNAEQTATSAEQSTSNSPGYCLQWSRERATIGALQPDAATAWKHAFNRHPGDRNPPRGAMVYWLGGSHGYGHIAVSVGGGRVRSTDSGGTGVPATVELSWPEQHWGLPYAGWADNVNDVAIPGVGTGDSGKDDDMPQYDHAACKRATKLPAGEWVGIEWTDVGSGSAFTKGSKAAKLGGRTYSAVLHVTVADAEPGSTIRLRTIEAESGNTAEENPVTEVIATGGGSAGTHAQVGHVKSGRDLRFRIKADKGGTLTAADAAVVSW